MKFSDIFINEWAGNKNPQKVLLFLSFSGRYINCLTLKGKVIQLYKEAIDEGKITVVGRLDLSEWQKKADELVKVPD